MVKLLLLLLQAAFLDFIGAELLEIIGKTELLPEPNRPFGGIILMPLNGIAVVGGEFVMEVVIALTKCDQRSDDMIPRRVAVIEWLVSEPVSQGIDAESGLLDEEDAEDARVDEATQPISPTQPCNDRGKDETHEDDDLQVILVLPDNDRIFIQVGDIGTSNPLWVLLHDHPSNVRVQKPFPDRIWVFIGIGISVVGAVVAGPPSDRTLDSTTADGGEEDPQRKSGRV